MKKKKSNSDTDTQKKKKPKLEQSNEIHSDEPRDKRSKKHKSKNHSIKDNIKNESKHIKEMSSKAENNDFTTTTTSDNEFKTNEPKWKKVGNEIKKKDVVTYKLLEVGDDWQPSVLISI